MSYRELIYRVAMQGQAEFARDLRGLGDMMRKAAAEEVTIARAVAARKRAEADGEAKHKAALLRTQIAIEKARAKASVREAEKAERDKMRAAETAEKQRTKTAERETRARERAERDRVRATIRQQAEETRAFERAERERTRVATREARVRQREEEAIRRATMRAQEATSRHIFREREKSRRAAEREEYQASRDRMFDRKRFYRGVATGIVEGGVGAVRAGVGLARSISAGMGLGNAYDIQDIVAERMYASRMMRSVAIEARTAGSAFGGTGFSEQDALAKVARVARNTGFSQRDLLGAIDAASEKGSGADAVNNLERIATQAAALGTDTTTIAKLRAQMKLSAGVAGQNLGDDEIDKLVAQMHFIGKTGVFRAEDLAKESESLFSQFAKSGMSFSSGFTRYIAFANEARKATGSGAMARTAINSLQDSIAKKEGKINALGIETRDGQGNQRDFIDVAMDVIQKTGARGDTFNKIFDPSRSGKAISTMVSAFQSAGGGAAGRKAMEQLLAGDASLKSATVAEMNKDAALRLDEPSAKIQKSVEVVRQALADKLAPTLESIAKNAPAIADTIAKAFEWIVKHPAMAAGAVVGFGAIRGGAAPMAGAGLRFAGDMLANVVPGFGSRAAGGALSAAGNALSSAGATPVYVTGAAPGVFGGGGAGIPGVGAGVGAGLAEVVGGVAGRAGLVGAVGYMALSSHQYGEGGERKMLDAQASQAKYLELKAKGYTHEQAIEALKNGTPAEQVATAAMNSPYENPQDYIDKYLDPGFMNSPFTNPDQYGEATGNAPGKGVGWGVLKRVGEAAPPPMAMPVAAGQPGYGVLAPTPASAPDGASDMKQAVLDFGKAVDEVNRKLAALGANASAIRLAPTR